MEDREAPDRDDDPGGNTDGDPPDAEPAPTPPSDIPTLGHILQQAVTAKESAFGPLIRETADKKKLTLEGFILASLKSMPRGAAPGPSGNTAEDLLAVIANGKQQENLLLLATRILAIIDGRIPVIAMDALCPV